MDEELALDEFEAGAALQLNDYICAYSE